LTALADGPECRTWAGLWLGDGMPGQAPSAPAPALRPRLASDESETDAPCSNLLAWSAR
jgi:hypothetical protein